MNAKHWAIAALLVVAGCTSMPDVKVEGIDGLKTTEHVLGPVEVAVTCTNLMRMPAFMAILTTPLACAYIVLPTWTCDIYYSELFAGVSLDHERLHCRGYWHDDGLREYRDAWRSNKERDA